MKFVSVVLLFLGLGLPIQSQAILGFGSKKVLPQHICNQISDKQIKSACMTSFFKVDSKQKLLPLCKNLSETIDSLKVRNWNHVVDCLDHIAYIPEPEFSDKQIEFCNQLLDKSENSGYLLQCLEKYDPTVLELCRAPLEKGSYSFAQACLKAVQGYQVNSDQLADLKQCLNPDKNQSLAAFSWSTYAPCLQNKLEKIPGNPVRSRYIENAKESPSNNWQK